MHELPTDLSNIIKDYYYSMILYEKQKKIITELNIWFSIYYFAITYIRNEYILAKHPEYMIYFEGRFCSMMKLYNHIIRTYSYNSLGFYKKKFKVLVDASIYIENKRVKKLIKYHNIIDSPYDDMPFHDIVYIPRYHFDFNE